MAKSEDSSEETLVIGETSYEYEINEILESSYSNVEVDGLNYDTKYISSSLNPSSPSTRIGLNCKLCLKTFSSNNDLLNHIRKFNGRLGLCLNIRNITTTRKNENNILPQHFMKKKLIRSLKIHTSRLVNTPTSNVNTSCPQNIPIIYNHYQPSDNLQLSHKILNCVIKPEYSCTKCHKIFRYYIALISHLNSDHNDVSNNSSSAKLIENKEKKKRVQKNYKNKKEPISDIINLTLVSDYKKDSLMNRMKSYLYTTSKKGQVTCILCNLEFKNTKKALAHVGNKHITKKIECGYCSKKFVYELKLRSHMAKKHKVICVYKCNKCLKMINNEESQSHTEKCEKIKKDKD